MQHLTADRGHDPMRLPIVSELMLRRFFGQRLGEAGAHFGFVHKGAEGGLKLEFAVVATIRKNEDWSAPQ
jgi:hypothetical protein